MGNIIGLLLIIVITGFSFGIYMGFRNEKTFRFLVSLYGKIDILSKQDINQGKDFEWRLKVFETVSYDDIYNKFWLPLKPESFWDDLSFLDIEKEKCNKNECACNNKNYYKEN